MADDLKPILRYAVLTESQETILGDRESTFLIVSTDFGRGWKPARFKRPEMELVAHLLNEHEEKQAAAHFRAVLDEQTPEGDAG